MLDQRELTLTGFNGSLIETKESPVWITADFGGFRAAVAVWPNQDLQLL